MSATSTTIDTSRPFIPLNIAILTISDTRTLEDDISGDLLVERLQQAGHKLGARQIVPDEVEAIRAVVTKWVAQKQADVIISTGGTGFTARDVTPEAIEPILNKKMDGFSTLFHLISYQNIGSVTIQSRSLAGLIDTTLIFCLPGSKGACRDGWDGILAGQLDNRQRPSNFVELMPRFSQG